MLAAKPSVACCVFSLPIMWPPSSSSLFEKIPKSSCVERILLLYWSCFVKYRRLSHMLSTYCCRMGRSCSFLCPKYSAGHYTQAFGECTFPYFSCVRDILPYCCGLDNGIYGRNQSHVYQSLVFSAFYDEKIIYILCLAIWSTSKYR